MNQLRYIANIQGRVWASAGMKFAQVISDSAPQLLSCWNENFQYRQQVRTRPKTHTSGHLERNRFLLFFSGITCTIWNLHLINHISFICLTVKNVWHLVEQTGLQSPIVRNVHVQYPFNMYAVSWSDRYCWWHVHKKPRKFSPSSE